jgi:hypothetical protein
MTPDEIAGRFANSYDELNTTILKASGYAAAVAAPRTGAQFYGFPLDANGFLCGTVDAACVLPTSNLGHYAHSIQDVRVPNDDLSALQAKNPIAQFIFNSQPQLAQNSKIARFDNSLAAYAVDGYNGYGARGMQVLDNRYGFRIDENVTDRDRVFFRYTSTPVGGVRYDSQGPTNPLEQLLSEYVHSQNMAISYVRVCRSNRYRSCGSHSTCWKRARGGGSLFSVYLYAGCRRWVVRMTPRSSARPRRRPMAG